MKAIFIHPQNPLEGFFPQKIPFSPLTAVAMTDTKGYATGLLDLNVNRNYSDPDALKKEMEDSDYDFTDLFIVHANCAQFSQVKWILPVLKKTRKDAVIALAGGLPSALPYESLTLLPEVDVCVTGEFEACLTGLLSNAASENWGALKGTWYRNNGRVEKTGAPSFVNPLDQLPLPAYWMFRNEVEAYLQTPVAGLSPKAARSRRRIILEAHRGSRRDEGFHDGLSRWDLEKTYGEQVKDLARTRFFSAKYLVNHVEYLRRVFGVDFVSFHGPDFMADEEWVRGFCKAYMDTDLHLAVPWGCDATLENCNENLLLTMKDAGCDYLVLRVETASPRLRKELGLCDMALAQKTVADLKRIGISFAPVFRIGMLGEDNSGRLDTLEYCRRNGFQCEPLVAGVEVGSSLWESQKTSLLSTKYFEEGGMSKLQAYLEDLGRGMMYSPSGETEISLLGAQSLMKMGSVERYLKALHETDNLDAPISVHSDKWIAQCPVCKRGK